jgi:hypothetical protein
MDTNKDMKRSSGGFVCIQENIFLLFCGGNREDCFNDFFQLNIEDTNWKEIKFMDNNEEIISKRFGFAYCYDYKNNNLYLHGGQNFKESKFFSALVRIKLNVKNDGLVEICNTECLTKFPIDINNDPIYRNSHCMCIYGNNLFLFGGGNSEGLLNDFWKYSMH